jgi:DNA-binding NtrC family response regulator
MKSIIVSDNSFKSLSDILKTIGFDSNVKSTHSENTLVLCQRKVNVVFLDTNAKDVDIFQLAIDIKALNKKICVVLVSDSVTKEIVCRAKEARIKSFLQKPFSKSTIIEALEKFNKSTKKKKSKR